MSPPGRASHSFYFDDTALPNGMGFAFGGISPLYEKVARRVDLHGALFPGDGGWTEIARLRPDLDTALYAPTRRVDDVVRNYVDRGPGFWVTLSVAGATQRVIELSLTAAESLAYWILEIYPWIADATTLGAVDQETVEVRLVLPGDGWFNETEEPLELPVSQVVDGRVEILLHPSFRLALMRADNYGERELVRALARGLKQLGVLRVGGDGNEDDASVDASVDHHAPLGIKKHLLLVDAGHNPALFSEDLPRLRQLQDADDAVVLDRLGPAVAEANALPIGSVSPDDRLAVLRSAVSWALDNLGRELAVLSEDALPWFVAQYERLIQAQARDRLAAPTQLACFGDTPAIREGINRKFDDYVHTALAMRTVIEHLTARPPRGIRPMSLEVHDRALALANEAIKRAYAYDGMKYELHDVKVSILPSGRLGMSRGGALETASDRFVPIYAAAELDRSVKGFAGHWEAGSGEATRATLAELDPAATVEFGFSITELATLLAETSALGLELPGAAKLMPLDQLVARLTDRLGWPPERVASAVDLFSLRARDEFLTPPAGFNDNDAYPWRFNRNLSFARRPLLIRETTDGQQVVFGMRQAIESAEYLYDLCTSARLRAQTLPMQQAIGAIRDKQTRAFVARVADHFRAPGSTVATGIKKVGGRKISRPSGDLLGDIDVLVVSPGAHKIISIEVKDLAVARTPSELESQLEHIFVTRGKRRARAAVHVERTEYLRAHVPELLADMGIADDGFPWTVEPLMVTSRELLTHHLAESAVPVISFQELNPSTSMPPQTLASPILVGSATCVGSGCGNQ